MPTTEPKPPSPGRWLRLSRSLSAKLIVTLGAAMVVTFAALGYLNIRLHRKHLEDATLLSAERVSDAIKRSTSYSMLRNDREGMYHTIRTMAGEPGIVRIRIINSEGRITFSSDAAEIGAQIDKRAEACYACHAQAQPLARLNRPDRFRIFQADRHRILGIITPIENQPACSNAACHAHPAEQQILGVFDAQLSLERADAALAESTRRMLAYTIVAMLAIALLTGLFVWRLVGRPVRVLKDGTERLSAGDLGYQIEVGSHDEVGELAASFNTMSRQLLEAREEVTAWNRTLEERVEQKTRELKRAHEQVLHVEKMASIGKMAAVVAHEINNPLSGILTYSKLLRRWLAQGPAGDARRQEMLSSLELIESESRRCGDIVRNLLVFARSAPMNLEWTDLHRVVEQCVRLVQHKMELSGVQLQLELDPELPRVQCDPAQIEQLLLALVINALEAMPRGGNLWLRSAALPSGREVQLQVRDDGVGIPEEFLPHMFEPFMTTKEGAHGVGLGLAVSHSIVERHHGRIEVASRVGQGSTFTITLPVGEAPAPQPPAELAVKAR
ncbi:MAG TPA: ATP-binding protein [Terriglobales bacterium]|nr:ATP-binding protein [Terriglobales bacterium]